MNNIKIQYYTSPFGELILGSFNNQLCLCDWRYRRMRTAIDSRIQKGLHTEFKEEGSEVIFNTITQLNEYFQKNRTSFDIPLLFVGTDFQKQVWNMLLNIPYGQTQSYLGLSNMLNNPKAIRAVASANGANSISIIVPCHRIIGSNKELVGYAGGLQAKKGLLRLETNLNNNQLNLF